MKQNQPLKVLVTGGGTAGHVYPVLAVITAIQQKLAQNHRSGVFMFVGRRASSEAALVAAAGVSFVGISGGKLRRYVDMQNFLDPFRVMLGFFESLATVIRFRPDVVFAKGGYVSVPVVFAAWCLRVPIVLHETDAVIGLSNRLGSRLAKVLCTSFPVSVYKQRKLPVELRYTGNPVRAEFFNIRNEVRASAPFTVLIVGGSQGALAINRSVEAFIDAAPRNVSIIHVTGPSSYAEYAKRASTTYHPIAYSDHLSDLVAQADVVISRAGGSLFELAAAAKPAIVVPLSSSASHHQQVNAEYFSSRKAAIVLDESVLSQEVMKTTITDVLKNVSLRRELSAHIAELALPDAAAAVADVVITNAH